MGLYDRQIELLELLIDRWYDIKDKDDFYEVFGTSGRGISEHAYGLCYVCCLEDLRCKYYEKMLEEWMYFNGDYDYPVDHRDEFVKMALITENPKRLHLAVYCLQWLRQRNTISEESKVGKRRSNR